MSILVPGASAQVLNLYPPLVLFMLTGQFHVDFRCSKHPEASTMPRCRHRIRTPAHCRLKLFVQSNPQRLGTSTGRIWQNNLTLKWLHHVTCKGCKRCPVTRRRKKIWRREGKQGYLRAPGNEHDWHAMDRNGVWNHMFQLINGLMTLLGNYIL